MGNARLGSRHKAELTVGLFKALETEYAQGAISQIRFAPDNS